MNAGMSQHPPFTIFLWDILVSIHPLFHRVDIAPYRTYLLAPAMVAKAECFKFNKSSNISASSLWHFQESGIIVQQVGSCTVVTVGVTSMTIYSEIVDLKGNFRQPCSRSRLETQACGAEGRTMRFTNSGKLSSKVLTQTLYLGCQLSKIGPQFKCKKKQKIYSKLLHDTLQVVEASPTSTEMRRNQPQNLRMIQLMALMALMASGHGFNWLQLSRSFHPGPPPQWSA